MIRTRFAPSPTGFVHVGSLRTALYCYLFSKQNKGNYILRIEDTDRTRYIEGSIENLLKEMEWAGIIHDEGPYIQSERLDIYKKYVDKLLEEGNAYKCFCTKERLDKLRESSVFGYDGKCRNLSQEEIEENIKKGKSYVVRLKMPKNKEIKLNDIVRGEVIINSDDSDDQVLLKTDGFPTYHMAVVVDDHLMNITHIIRGEEWLSSTPKHIVLYEALGWDIPKYAHLPNILGTNRKKLSKRTGDVSVSVFREKGYLPEALVNFLALVGWSPGTEQEIMSIDELIKYFSFDRVSKSPGVFDIDKLKYINNHYIKKSDNIRLLKIIEKDLYMLNDKNKENILKIIDLVKEKADTVLELIPYIEEFYIEFLDIDKDVLDKMKDEKTINLLKYLIEKFRICEFNIDRIKEIIKSAQKEIGLKGKALFMPIRIAVTSKEHGSDLVKTIKLLGREKTISRINKVLEKIHEVI